MIPQELSLRLLSGQVPSPTVGLLLRMSYVEDENRVLRRFST